MSSLPEHITKQNKMLQPSRDFAAAEETGVPINKYFADPQEYCELHKVMGNYS